MKKTSMIVTCFMMFSAIAFAQNAEKKTFDGGQSSNAQISWLNSETIDMGKIEKGKPVSVTFEFKNTGDVPLLISSAKGQCGCTKVEYTMQAVKPNEKGFIKATYNAAKEGGFNKSITVTANTNEPQIILHIKGEVN
jgi:hypothetical protein